MCSVSEQDAQAGEQGGDGGSERAENHEFSSRGCDVSPCVPVDRTGRPHPTRGGVRPHRDNKTPNDRFGAYVT